jgi:hypothetical protein
MKNTEYFASKEPNIPTADNTTHITKLVHIIAGVVINRFTAVILNLTAAVDGPVTIRVLKVLLNIVKTPAWECYALKSFVLTVADIRVMFLMMDPRFRENVTV